MTGTLLTRKAQSAPWLRDPLWTRARSVPSLDLRMEDALLRDSVSGQQLVTFTRASPGTYVGSDGLIKSATTNLLLRSEEFDNASWLRTSASAFSAGSVANATTAPNGSNTADFLAVANAISSGSGFFFQDVAKSASTTTYTVSVYAKAGNWDELKIQVHDVATYSNRSIVAYSLATGAVTTDAVSAGTFSAASATPAVALGDGWYRLGLVFTSSTETGLRVRFYPTNSISDVSDGTKGIYVWGAQLEQSSSVGEYIPTGASINSAPRITHDTEVLGEARTNLLVRSEELDNASWSKLNVTVTANTVTAPDGMLTADTLREDSSTGTHSFAQFVTIPTSGVAYTHSIYAKPISSNRELRITLPTAAFGSSLAATTTFGNQTITIGTLSQGATATIASVGNGWFRISITATATAVAVGSYSYLICNESGIASYTGDGASGIYIWGAQLEEGSTATDYIPTKGVFTSRATTATYYDSQGVIRTAAINEGRGDAYLPDENGVFRPIGLQLEDVSTNLLRRSEEFDNASWGRNGTPVVTANAAASPSGATTADLISPIGIVSGMVQFYSHTSGKVYTASVFVKDGGDATKTITIGVSGVLFGGGSDKIVTYNISTGALSGINAVFTSTAVTSLANGWYRVALTYTPTVSAAGGYRIYGTSATNSFYLWGAQLEEGSTATSYIPTTTAAVTRTADSSISTPVTKTPTLHRRLGLLVEEARTNLWAWSNSAVTGETWTNTLLVSTAGEPDPAGGTSAILASDIGTATAGTFYQRTSVVGVAPLSAGTTVSYSIFIKPIDLPNSWVALNMFSNGFADTCSASFVTSGTTFTGAINPGQGGTGSVVSTKLETLSNGWYRLTLTGIVSTVTQSDLRTRVNIGNYTRVEGTPRFVWYGAQLEAGSFPTSYIPTTGGPETRLDDIATVTGTNFSRWYRQDALSIYSEAAAASPDTISCVYSLNNESTSQEIYARTQSAQFLSYVQDGTGQFSQSIGTLSPGTLFKGAFAGAVNNGNSAINGVSGAVDTSMSMPTATLMQLGTKPGVPQVLNGTISRLTFWPARLPDSTLQSLTR